MTASATLVLDVVESISAAPRHGTVVVSLNGMDPVAASSVLTAWCAHARHELVEVDADRAVVRKGPRRDPVADLPLEQRPGKRLWLYTNFHCSLACDYCCVRSSPTAAPRTLTLDQVQQLASEAVAAGVSELVLTGGEPFLLPDLEQIVAACTRALPTTLLTNGMLLRGPRLEALQRMDPARLTLQISLDSADPDLHDQHRGRGSWDKAVAGIRTARSAGFRVKVAATLTADQAPAVDVFHSFLHALGIPREDRLIRLLARRGFAEEGLELGAESVVPEVTVTADGIYWHPVGATDDDMLVTRHLFPLDAAISEVRHRYAAQRAIADSAAQWFPCA